MSNYKGKHFVSCKDAKDKGYTDSGHYLLKNSNHAFVSYCDMQLGGGGWTRVLHKKETALGYMPVYPIDDMDLTYTEVMVITGPEHLIHYSYPNPNFWVSKGVDVSKNFLQFEDLKYKARYPDEDPASTPPEGYSFLPVSTFTRLGETPDQCYTGSVHYPDYCFRQFTMTALGRLRAFGDHESDVYFSIGDDYYVYDISIYVR